MQTPLRVTFRHMQPSSVLEAAVASEVQELEALCPRM